MGGAATGRVAHVTSPLPSLSSAEPSRRHLPLWKRVPGLLCRAPCAPPATPGAEKEVQRTRPPQEPGPQQTSPAAMSNTALCWVLGTILRSLLDLGGVPYTAAAWPVTGPRGIPLTRITPETPNSPSSPVQDFIDFRKV